MNKLKEFINKYLGWLKKRNDIIDKNDTIDNMIEFINQYSFNEQEDYENRAVYEAVILSAYCESISCVIKGRYHCNGQEKRCRINSNNIAANESIIETNVTLDDDLLAVDVIEKAIWIISA